MTEARYRELLRLLATYPRHADIRRQWWLIALEYRAARGSENR